MSSQPDRQQPFRLIKPVTNPNAKILFLGYDETHTRLIDALVQHGCEVWHTDTKVTSLADFDSVISFGYRHILKQPVLDSARSPVVNLHISYLPYNRGAHPNFWAFYDGTPSGVSIHLIDAGIDTGPIIYQKHVNFDLGEVTFSQTHKRLTTEIEALFLENMERIISRSFVAISQAGIGTMHRAAELPEAFAGWESDIKSEIKRLRSLQQA